MIGRIAWLGAAALIAVAGFPAGVPAAGQDSPAFSLVQNRDGAGGPACKQDLNLHIVSEQGWRFTARTVEVTAEGVSVSIAFRNDRAASGLIALVPEDQSRVRLVDEGSARDYPAETMRGIEAELRKVQRDTTAYATFVFPIPGEARQVKFESTWVTPIMRGAGQKIQVAFPITLPALGACGA